MTRYLIEAHDSLGHTLTIGPLPFWRALRCRLRMMAAFDSGYWTTRIRRAE